MGAMLPSKFGKLNSMHNKVSQKLDIIEETKSPVPRKPTYRPKNKYLNTKDTAYKEQIRKFKSRTFLLPEN